MGMWKYYMMKKKTKIKEKIEHSQNTPFSYQKQKKRYN